MNFKYFFLFIFLTLTCSQLSFANSNSYTFTFAAGAGKSISIGEVNVKNKKVYLVESGFGKGRHFSRAIPESYYKKSVQEFKKWNQKMLRLGPIHAMVNCGDKIVASVDGQKFPLCFEVLSRDEKKQFMLWYRENVRISQLTYGAKESN